MKKYLYFLLLFLILYIIIKLLYIECFNNTNIQFLNKDELYVVLKSNNTYYSTFYNNDMKVRNIKSLEEYFKNIKESVVDFNENEKDILILQCEKADNIIKNINMIGFDGIKCSNIMWKFGLTKGKLYEEGLPHTVKDTIILNRNIFSNINTLIHEKIHIYQKMYPEDIKLWLKNNNFRIVKEREENDNVRANPDIDKYIYMKNNTLYSNTYNDNPKSILDVTNSQLYEHPFEYMAIVLSTY